MVGLIIATHGNTSEELKKSVEMFSGPLEDCKTWTLNPGDDIESGEKKLEQYADQLDKGDGVLIMTDLFGGTPSNLALKVSMRKNVEVLTGVNLPMLIQFVSGRNEESMDELITECIEIAQNGIMSPSKEMKVRRCTNGGH